MTGIRVQEPVGGGRGSAWVTAILVVSAAATVGYWTVRAFGEEDTEAMESPLILSVARQFEVSPWELYGPFGGSNPLVLIHAPLYYRAAALLAWPVARAGLPPIDAARLAGRLISMVALVATAKAAYRLARLGGLPARAGWWSALLVAASPVLSGQPFAVRPDMAGVALQTWGVVLVLEGLGGRRHRLEMASALFGLAACVKQHLIAAWAVSVALAALAWLRGRAGLGSATRVVLLGVMVAVLVYGAEWVATSGRIWEAAFVAAANVGRVHPGGWDFASVVLLGVAERSGGLVALLSSAALIAAGSRPGVMRQVLIALGTVAIGVILGALIVQTVVRSPYPGVVAIMATVLVAVVALPAVALSVRSLSTSIGVDAALWVYLAAEVGMAAFLSRSSTGAWLNYGIPATVFTSALAARGLSRALDANTPRGAALPAVLASLAVLASSLYGVGESDRRHRGERAVARAIYEHFGRPRSCYFFTDRPGFNRLNGRLELVHDDWLYPVFESIGLAEPRWRWLGRALFTGPVRAVVATTEGPLIEGTKINLRLLGYRADSKLEPFYVWIR